MVGQLEAFSAGRSHPGREALARRLIDTGKLTATGAERASWLAQESGERLERVLARLGLGSERDLAEIFGALLALPVAAAEDYPDLPVLEDRVDPKFRKEGQIIP